MKKIKILGVLAFVSAIILLSINTNKKSIVELGEYLNVEVSLEEIIVTDKDVENTIKETIAMAADYKEINNRSVINGDIVNIDYAGSIDGDLFDGGSANGYDLEIGSKTFIDGFEEQIIGMALNEIKDIKVNFPESYPNNPELENKEATFTITLNSIKVKDIPEVITDEVINNLSNNHSTLKEYQASILEILQEQAKQQNITNAKEAVYKQVLDNANIKQLSTEKSKYYGDLFVKYYTDYAKEYAVELDEFLETFMGITKAEFNKEKDAYIESVVSEFSVIEEIAKLNDIVISDEEFDQYVEENEIDDEELLHYKTAMKDEMLYRKVIDFLYDHATIIYT